MHQPWYLREGAFTQPWVFLHGLKSYADMAAHLETVQGARAVVNFVPTLLDQIALYVESIRGHLANGAPLADPLLAALVADQLPERPDPRDALIGACLMVHPHHTLARYPKFRELAELARAAGASPGRYLGDRYITDLLVWFLISWFGEHRHRSSAELLTLMEKQQDFSREDRRFLLALIGQELQQLIPRYRALAESGRVELSVSPWAHPILPLLLDLRSGRDAQPHLAMPLEPVYPGGAERVRWHLERAIGTFEQHFGFAPVGCWPSEGAVSKAALAAIGAAGFKWAASGGAVLDNSLARSGAHASCRHRVFRVSDTGIACFFRDDGLSDLLGFSYQHWDPRDAVANLISHLENIAAHCDCPDMIVSIIMDGENAWEHYPANGFDFLQQLYAGLAEHPRLRLTTFADYLDRDHIKPARLPELTAGSWVHGTLATWIGNPAKNRAWDLLVAAKRHYDEQPEAVRGPDARSTIELGLCEGSDWFWWLDEFNEAATVARFDGLFRSHLRALYRALDVPTPSELSESLVTGTAQGPVQTMRRAHE
jgi:alpha-amylase/alpha-mannosidase (GH57 family)